MKNFNSSSYALLVSIISAGFISERVFSQTKALTNPSTKLQMNASEPDSKIHFGLSPLIGYEWAKQDNTRLLSSSNSLLLGAQVSGMWTKWIGTELSFLYGHDTFKLNNSYTNPYGAYTNNNYGNAYNTGNNTGYMNNGYNNGYNTNGYNNMGTYVPDLNSLSQITRDSYDFGLNMTLGPQIQNVRPYLILGADYVDQEYKMPNTFMQNYLQSMGSKSSTQNYAGRVGAGFDAKFSEHAQIGLRADYLSFFGSTSSAYMNTMYGDTDSRLRVLGSLGWVF